MTTNIQTFYTNDITQANDVYHIDRNSISSKEAVAAIEWLCKTDHSLSDKVEHKIKVLNYIYDLFKNRLQNYNVWLLTGNSCWQDNTRVVQYYGYWGALKRRGISFPHTMEHYEHSVVNDNKIRYFCALKVDLSFINTLVKLICEERNAFILALPKTQNIDYVVSQGWDMTMILDKSLLSNALNLNAILLRDFGNFDDLEAGFLGIGQKRLIDILL